MEKYYAISYYGRRYTFGYIEMDFIGYDSVQEFAREDDASLWNNAKIISANVPLNEYNKYFGNKQMSLIPGGTLYIVDLEIGEHGFRCNLYEPREDIENDIRVKLISAKETDDATLLNALMNKFKVTKYPKYDYEKSKVLDNIGTGEYNFKVYKVGQGLATSIEKCGEIPFLYFDYGNEALKLDPMNILQVPVYSKYVNGVPNSDLLSILLVSPSMTHIFLSHTDSDHWRGYMYNKDSLLCVWVVPDQVGRARYYSLLNKIIHSGGKVFVYNKDIDMGAIYIGNSNSALCPSRTPESVHQDGYAMYINGYTQENNELKKCKITVAGDQDYDYQDSHRYSDSNILVACHHGGDYCWSKKFTGIKPSGSESVVIYSYGKGNKYHHPTKRKDYEQWGWKNKHDIPSDGEFCKKICFR